jgi:hypothetical protein
MAVKAGNFIDSMVSSVPVMQVESRVGGVAFEADERLGRGGQVLQIDQGFKITWNLDALPGFFLNHFFGQILNSQAAGAVTGFTVHERQTGFLLQLSPHGAGNKEKF